MRLGRALRNRTIVAAVAMLSVPAILNGAMLTLGPLRLDSLGVGAGAIGLTFALAAGATMVARPLLGRWSDRGGRHRPTTFSPWSTAALLVCLALIRGSWLACSVVVAVVTAGALSVESLWSPTCASALASLRPWRGP